MDMIFLSRLQFASTTIFHFLFVPISIGLVFIIAIMESFYVKTGNEEYKKWQSFGANYF